MTDSYLSTENHNLPNNMLISKLTNSLKEKRLPKNNNNTIIYSSFSKGKPEQRNSKINDSSTAIESKKINRKRSNSKPKPIINNESTNKNNINEKDNKVNSNKKNKSNNNPIILRPRTSKSKPMIYNNHNKNTHVAISAINKDETQNINNSDYNYNNKNTNCNNKKPTRPMSTKSNNISK